MGRFRASTVAAEESIELGSFVVILAEDEDGDGQRLELHRGLSFDEQDVDLGQDTYALSVEWGATHYGGIVAWRLLGTRLEIQLDQQASGVLETEGFEIEVPAAKVDLVRKGLQRVIGGANDA
jgi:hypothetical protein